MYPEETVSQHLAIMLSDYNCNFDGVSDKEFENICKKYKSEKELDIVVTGNRNLNVPIDKIIEESMTLEGLMKGINNREGEEEEEDGY